MALSKEERCRELARLVGIPLLEAEVSEVAERFESLRSLAAWNRAGQIAAVASVNQLILVALDEFAGMIFVAGERI